MLMLGVRIVTKETHVRKRFRIEPLFVACVLLLPELGILMKQPYAKPVLRRRGLLSPITAVTTGSHPV